MRPLTTALGAPVALIALGLALSGCGSNGTTTASSTSSGSSASSGSSSSSSSASSASSSAATKTSPAAPAKAETIADYVKEGGFAEAPVRRGEPGAPVVDLPVPANWVDAGDKTPEWAYSAIVYADPAMATDPPTITAIMSKLTGDVEQAKIFEYAPGELKNLPDFEGAGEGSDAKLGGFDAFQIGGSYVRDGVKRMIAQKTVFIPATDGSGAFVLQLNADGTEDQIGPLMDATSEIDEKTVITP